MGNFVSGPNAFKFLGQFGSLALLLAAAPAASFSGWSAIVNDWGTHGAFVTSDGTRYRPVNGMLNTAKRTADVAAIGTTPTIVLQALYPIGSLAVGDSFRIWGALTKSGPTDVGRVTVHFGPLGTTADPFIGSINGAAFVGATALSGGALYACSIGTATTAQKDGQGQNGTSSYSVAVVTAPATPVAISDITANAMYLSMAIYSGGATNTVGAQIDSMIQHSLG